MYNVNLASFTDFLSDEITNSQESQPLSFSSEKSEASAFRENETQNTSRPAKGTGQHDKFRSIDEIDVKYRNVFSYPFFNLVQSSVIEDALYSDKSMVICAPTGSGKTVVFEMAIVQLLMELEDTKYKDDFKIIYMAPVKALCTERLTEWYPKFTKLGLLCIEVTGDTDVDFSQLKPYRIIITTPEKWDMVTRRWREHSQLVEVIKLFLIDEVHILNDETRGPVLEAVVSRMKTIEASAKSVHRIQQLQKQYQGTNTTCKETAPKIRFVAVSATVSNPGDVATWLGTADKPAVFYKFGDESRPVKLKRIVEGYSCPEGASIFKFDIILNYKLWPVIQKYHDGKPTLIFCNTRKSVTLTAEVLSRELTVSFSPEQKAKLMALASTIKNKKLQMLVLSGVGCHHAGLLYEERNNIEHAFRNRDLPILITTTTLAMGVNLPAHLVIIKNTQQYVKGAYQEYSISTILQMVGRAGRPQFDTEATAVIMTRHCDKPRYQALVGGSEPLQSYLHKRLAENLNSEAALGTVNDVAQCVQWVRSTFLNVRAARDPKRYLGLPQGAPQQLISKKIEELCVKAMNGLASSGLITMDEACCIESTEAGRLMSVFYLDLETMKHIMKINGTETLERLLWLICESHELADMHLRVDERRCLNMLNRNQAATTIRFPMKGKISTRQMKLNCMIQAILGCLNIPDPSLNQEAMKIMRIALRVCKCLVAYVTRPVLISEQPKFYSAALNALILTKCIAANLWENSPYVSKQLKGIGPTFSTLLASAGKINFMLLEESHPRDLERIMNKGPPAGNVLRKQVGLLPKYQLTMTPINEKSVTIQLVLLNRSHLSENADQLTAGDSHKSYMIVGDSENNLLLLTSFMDKDLMGVYDGVITHQVTRKHSFEHNVFVNCISSSFVGIDVQCAYLFKSLEAVHPSYLNTNENFIMKPATKQTNITDTFKERKRKNMSENDTGQPKEKKKRENVLLEKFKSLKESFGKTSREIKENLNKSTVISNKILQEFTNLESPSTSTEIISVHSNKRVRIEPSINNPNTSLIPNTNKDQIYSEENSEMNDEKINNILIEIENEISKCNKGIDLPRVYLNVDKNAQSVSSPYTSVASYSPKRNNLLPKGNKAHKSLNKTKNNLQKNNRSNYDFIDLLNKNLNLSDEEDELVNNKASVFSDTIKNQIEKYLQQTKTNLTVSDKLVADLLIGSEQNKCTSGDNYEIGSKVKDFSENDAVNVSDETNAQYNINFVTTVEKNVNEIKNIAMNNKEMKHINYPQKKTINSQSHIFEGDQIIADVISNTCVMKKPSRSIDLNRNVADKPTQNKITSALNQVNVRKRDDNVLKDNITKCNLSQLTLHTNCYEENRTALFQQPSTMQYQLCKSPEIRETQKQIICHSNTANSRSEANTERCDSEPEQYTAILSENSSNFSNSPPYNQHSNVRKYSYSATKVDVATREDHITIIRKIKMDVDVTEIIGKKGSENNKHQDIKNSENNEQQNYTNNSEMKRISFEDHEPHVEGEESKKIDLALNRCQNINNTEKNKKQMYIHKPATKCIDYAMQEPYVHNETNIFAMTYDNRDTVYNEQTEKNIRDVFTQQKDEENFVSPKLITLPSKFSPKNKQIEHKTSNFDIKDDEDAIDKSSNKNLQNETDRLGSILQKYSKILRKNNEGNLSQTPTEINAIKASCNNAISQKLKRPFKISEIQNLKTPLLRLQLSSTPTSDNLNGTNDTPPIRDNFETYIKQNKEFIQTQKQPYDIPEQQEMWQHFGQNPDGTPNEEIEEINDDIEELSKFELQDSEIEELESTKIDFNLEQSMLNPKKLLQCFNTDETDIVVPPPPEFSDEVELTPQDVTVPMVSYEPMQWNDFQGGYLKESIFHDDSNIELTPRKEIETWLLPQDDDPDQNLVASASSHSRQSFTIMHTPKQRSSPFQNVSASRLTNLRQFKFSGKKKLVP